MRIETKAARAGGEPDHETGALTPPLHTSTTYERDADGSYPRGFVYSRWANPTRALLEETLADLEGGAGAIMCPSGMSAIDTLLRTLSPGDHVILPDDVYHATRQLLRDFLGRWGIRYTDVDQTDFEALHNAFEDRTRLVWVETPSNPLCKITDIEAVCKAAHARSVEVVVDSTWTTPLLQRPIRQGADFVVHSVTKYLSGHSDVLAGAVVAADAGGRFAEAKGLQQVAGSVASPFDCWLALRGIRSLGARMRLHCESAGIVARFLSNHPKVERVHYPGLPTHSGHEVARRQMEGFGGMMAFQCSGSEQLTLAVAGAMRVFRRATSLGGTESLVEHRASIESKPTLTPVNLLRLSIGLEHPDDLIDDLDRALSIVR
ncbi:MAG TPA: aminotransferase class I/II-fold pyridoxal phosphate-dependent enzyme [Rhodothermales bacterium]